MWLAYRPPCRETTFDSSTTSAVVEKCASSYSSPVERPKAPAWSSAARALFIFWISAGVAGRNRSVPITNCRTVAWPTMLATLIAGGVASSFWNQSLSGWLDAPS